MDEEALEKLREDMRELLLSLDINNIPDSDDDFTDEDYDDEWYQPIAIPDDIDSNYEISEQDDEHDEPIFDDDYLANDSEDELAIPEEATIESQTSDGISTQSQEENQPKDELKKKKKKNKKKNKKKKNYPAADDDQSDINGPVPPVAEDQYDMQVNFLFLSTSPDSRFRLAMDNFRRERIFVPISNQILETYFTYGGMDQHDLESTSKVGPTVETEVDIEYIVSSFLSSYIFESSIWYEAEYFRLAPKVIAAFLKYIHARDIIPEYQDSLEKAIEIAEIAKKEVPMCKAFNALMPDDIAVTCSALFLPDYISDQLPDDSISIMEGVVGVQCAQDVQVAGKYLQYARVVEIVIDKDINDPNSATKVILDDMIEREDSAYEGGLFPTGERNFIQLSYEAAMNLKVGTVVWGTFYKLTNNVVFSRPFMALPSFHVELDEDEYSY
ncbi:hypothetical protein BGZ76_011405 [Entomortierella beljakovae]|nr:hypothetical protein BGZ76_011405 [Entomortierella beljakovae]